MRTRDNIDDGSVTITVCKKRAGKETFITVIWPVPRGQAAMELAGKEALAYACDSLFPDVPRGRGTGQDGRSFYMPKMVLTMYNDTLYDDEARHYGIQDYGPEAVSLILHRSLVEKPELIADFLRSVRSYVRRWMRSRRKRTLAQTEDSHAGPSNRE